MNYPSRLDLLEEKCRANHAIKLYDFDINTVRQILQLGYSEGFTDGEKDYEESLANPVYCYKCGACGEAPCCPPDQCKSVQLHYIINDVLKEMESTSLVDENEEFEKDYFIYHIQARFKDGLYCDQNFKEYKEMAKQLNDFYKALLDIKNDDTGFDGVTIAHEILEKYYPNMC